MCKYRRCELPKIVLSSRDTGQTPILSPALQPVYDILSSIVDLKEYLVYTAWCQAIGTLLRVARPAVTTNEHTGIQDKSPLHLPPLGHFDMPQRNAR